MVRVARQRGITVQLVFAHNRVNYLGSTPSEAAAGRGMHSDSFTLSTNHRILLLLSHAEVQSQSETTAREGCLLFRPAHVNGTKTNQVNSPVKQGRFVSVWFAGTHFRFI